jgi:hypothetical protein
LEIFRISWISSRFNCERAGTASWSRLSAAFRFWRYLRSTSLCREFLESLDAIRPPLLWVCVRELLVRGFLGRPCRLFPETGEETEFEGLGDSSLRVEAAATSPLASEIPWLLQRDGTGDAQPETLREYGRKTWPIGVVPICSVQGLIPSRLLVPSETMRLLMLFVVLEKSCEFGTAA